MGNGISTDENRAIIIEGASDGTEIGNVNDRLKVTAFTVNLTDEQVIPAATKLVNGASPDMDVNGSVTPVVFSNGPAATNEEWYITKVSFYMDDNGTSNWNDFGAIAGGITNGVLVQIDINSVTYNIGLFKNNAELVANSDRVTRGVANSFIGDTNFVSVTTVLHTPILLKESQSDILKVTVQDDLSGLNVFNIVLGYIKVL